MDSITTRGEYDLAVLGAGSGGLVAAIVAHKLGLKTLLIEGGLFGGDCLNFGCVPSKSLIHSARAAAIMRNAETHGLRSVAPQFEWSGITDRIARIQDTIREHETPEYFRKMGLHVVEAYGSFVDPRTVEAGGERFSARKFVIATGSSAFVPPIEGLEETGFITNEQVFTLPRQPAQLAVIGGGPIGVEMAQAFARLGTTVSLIHSGDQILSREDPDMARVVHDTLVDDGVVIHLNARATRVAREAGGKVVEIESKGVTSRIEADEILIAVGRRPALNSLNLDAAGVQRERGGIVVSRCMRTSARHIFAVGDCIGGRLFTHAASLEASIAIRNIVFHIPAKVSYRSFGWCTYTEPELAGAGLNERTAAAEGIAYEKAEAEFADNDRALAESATAGKIKVLFRKNRFRRKIIGAQIVGPHAGELIHEYVLAIDRGLTFSKMAGPTHIYPTLSEINRRVAIDHLGRSFFSDRTRTWLRRIFRYRGDVKQA